MQKEPPEIDSVSLQTRLSRRFLRHHPRGRMVYAGHPGIPTVYVLLADFHRLTFEHKFAEVISLLMHLGAKTLKVEHITGWGAEFSSSLFFGLAVDALTNDPLGVNGLVERTLTIETDTHCEGSVFSASRP